MRPQTKAHVGSYLGLRDPVHRTLLGTVSDTRGKPPLRKSLKNEEPPKGRRSEQGVPLLGLKTVVSSALFPAPLCVKVCVCVCVWRRGEQSGQCGLDIGSSHSISSVTLLGPLGWLIQREKPKQRARGDPLLVSFHIRDYFAPSLWHSHYALLSSIAQISWPPLL